MPRHRSRQEPEENVLETLQARIPAIFDAVQTSRANWKTNRVNLHKIHGEMAQHYVNTPAGSQMIGEELFLDTVKDILTRVLVVKKGVAAADNVISFVASYTEYMNAEARNTNPAAEEDEDEDSEPDTAAFRFTKHLLRWLVKGFGAKDKTVRSRVLNAVSEMLPILGSITPKQFDRLEEAFVDRLQDKDPIVRRFAATCLGRLLSYDKEIQSAEDVESLGDLVDAMAHDPSSDVRKAIVENIPVFPDTLAAILERTRDTDTAIRKCVYDHLRKNIKLPKDQVAKLEEGESDNGPTHPKVLSIDQRELIVENGLKDRMPLVKTATANLLWQWYLTVKGDVKEEELVVKLEDVAASAGPEVDGSIAFLQLFDLGTCPASAEAALACLFKTQRGFADSILVPDSYWETLSQEKAFLARVLVEHYVKLKDNAATSASNGQNQANLVSQYQDRLDAILPEVTAVAAIIEDMRVQLGQLTAEQEEEYEEINIILSQLLSMAMSLDYSDEVGRRKMHTLMRESLQDPHLPESLISPATDLLRLLSNDERDFIRLVVENIQELRERIDDSEQPEEQPADADRSQSETPPPPPPREIVLPEVKDAIDEKCLKMSVSMLRNVMSPVEKNTTLDYVIAKLIVPRVAENRGRGPHALLALEAMSLCSLISETLAAQTLDYAQKSVRKGGREVRAALCKVMFDIYMVYQYDFYKKKPENLELVAEFLVDQLDREQEPDIKAILCEGVAKLVLAGMVSDDRAITTLAKQFVSPHNSKNEKLKQCLQGFFNIFSTSSSQYQEQLCDIFVLVFLNFCEDAKEVDEEEEAEANSVTVTSLNVAHLFVDWTDSSLLTMTEQNTRDKTLCTHLRLAENVVKLLINKDLTVEIGKEDKRSLCRLFDKLVIPDEVDDYKLRSLDILLDKLCTMRPLKDSVCKNAVNKFVSSLKKRFEAKLEGITEDELRNLEALQDLFEYVDDIIPLDDEDEDTSYQTHKRALKRRSDSIFSSPTGSRSASPAQPDVRRSKRARLSEANDDENNEPEDGVDDGANVSSERSTPMPTVRRPRPRPRPSAAAAAPQSDVEVIVISSDSDEDFDDPPPKTKRASKAKSLPFRPSVKQESPIDVDGWDGLPAVGSTGQTEASFDSIMDSEATNSEDDEEEVTDLLAEE